MDTQGRSVLQQIARFLLNVSREPLSLNPILLLDALDAGLLRGWRTFRYALKDRIEDKLPRLRAPTLVVSGARDPIAPHPWAEEVARLLPEGRLVVIPGAARVVNYDAPSELACAIWAFLEYRR